MYALETFLRNTFKKKEIEQKKALEQYYYFVGTRILIDYLPLVMLPVLFLSTE
jgi:hypothetical protein